MGLFKNVLPNKIPTDDHALSSSVPYFPIQISIKDGGVSHVSHIPDAPCWNMHTYIYPIFMAQFCR